MRDERERFAAAVLARDTVCAVASLLDGHGVAIMPIKGVLLQRLVYDDPSERAISDVDVLVAERDFDRTRSLLRQSGFRPRLPSPSLIEESFFAPSGLVLDLHYRLFASGRFRMATDDVLARATRDTALFGAPVLLPDPLDLYAHLVGKIASDHVEPGQGLRFDDVARVSRRLGLVASSAARHLDASGLGRAARYTLPWVAELAGDAFAEDVLAHLRHDPTGTVLAAGARTLLLRLPRRSVLRAIPSHLLNHSISAAALAVSIASVNRVRYRFAMRHSERGAAT